MKRAIAAVCILLVLACTATALAAAPGSAADPLISLSYLEGTVADFLNSCASAMASAVLKSDMDSHTAVIDEYYDAALLRAGAYDGYSLTGGFVRAELGVGASITLLTGGSFTLSSGSARMTISSGTVLDLTTGEEIKNASSAVIGHRYFCCENTRASWTAASDSAVWIDGYYRTIGDALVYDLSLPDAHDTDWYYDAAAFVVGKGLLIDAGSAFKPESAMTRGNVVYALWVLSGKPQFSTNRFSDLTDIRYVPAVAWASAVGITDGYSDGTFRPNVGVTREELAVFLFRFAEYLGKDTSARKSLAGFSDAVQISDWATDAIRWITAVGVMNGETVSTFAPQQNATRAEAATAIMNFVKAIMK